MPDVVETTEATEEVQTEPTETEDQVEEVTEETEETQEQVAEETPETEAVEETSEETALDASEAATVEETPEAQAEETTETGAADEAAEVPEALKPASPYDLPGDWYVIHSYSGYENKVKANLETRIQSMHMEDRIFEVHIPMEDVVEFKGGKKVTVPKKVFPGYILVRMILDDDSWYAVRNTPGVTGFVAGNAQKPTPLSRREVERFLGVQEEEEKGKPRFKPEWDVGEQVRVVTGPFADFNGVIEELNVDQQKVVVLVNIFGRDTPVELGFEDIQKN
ncbi:MAG TPA: transcription termination/antitermination protein NusG [Acidimicrobiia bacterium]|jgi:transcriptional antiterminator NusG|nr:transcription termination/antitermination protein NusG [Acidimicrobiia bacterium]